jgi:hypothetical protein
MNKEHCNKTLIIGLDISSIGKYDVDVLCPFRQISSILKPFRVLSLKYNIISSYWVRDFSTIDLSKYETVIVFDSFIMNYVMKEIEGGLRDTQRLVLFFWNPVFIYSKALLNSLSSKWEKWTFDHDDAIRFGYWYGGQFCFDLLFPTNIDKNAEKSDIYFIGANKGRFRNLFILEKQLNYLGLKTCFRFISKIKSFFNHRYSDKVPYSKMLVELISSKSILEYNQSEQKGLTLRAIESIYLGKKLVSTNRDIYNYDFYSPDRIFILGDRPTCEIIPFLSSEMDDYSPEIKSRYTFGSWLDRILNNEMLDDYKNEK